MAKRKSYALSVLMLMRCRLARVYGGEDLPDDISRGLFAGEVFGAQRLLKLLSKETRATNHLV